MSSRTNNSIDLCFRWDATVTHISLLDLLKVTFKEPFKDSLLVHAGMNEITGALVFYLRLSTDLDVTFVWGHVA